MKATEFMILGLFLVGLLYGVHYITNHQEPKQTHIQVDSMDQLKLNHLINSVDSIDRQQTATAQEIIEINIQIEKIRRALKIK